MVVVNHLYGSYSLTKREALHSIIEQLQKVTNRRYTAATQVRRRAGEAPPQHNAFS
jgi:hypothetical protein